MIIELPCYGISVDVMEDGKGAIAFSGDLKETCPYCSQQYCCYSCDESTAEIEEDVTRGGRDRHHNSGISGRNRNGNRVRRK